MRVLGRTAAFAGLKITKKEKNTGCNKVVIIFLRFAQKKAPFSLPEIDLKVNLVQLNCTFGFFRHWALLNVYKNLRDFFLTITKNCAIITPSTKNRLHKVQMVTKIAGLSKEIITMDIKNKFRSASFRKALAVVLMGTVCITAAVSVGSLSKKVTVTDGNETVDVSTINPDTSAVLAKTGIELRENDKVVRIDDGKDGVNLTILRSIDLEASDDVKEASFNESSVSDSLLSAGMTLSESENVSLAAALESAGSETEIKLARFEITVDVRGEEIKKYVPAGTVESALAFLEIEMGVNDTVDTDLTKNVEEGMKITITNVEYKTVTDVETVDYNTVYKDSDSLDKGETSYETYGVEGERTIVTKEKYVNGVLDSKEVISDKITKEAVDAVVLQGTKEKQTYSASYTYPGSGHLTPTNGVYYGPSGKETWYDMDMYWVVDLMRKLGYSEAEYPYWIRSDGCKMLGDYVMVAADLSIRPRGSLVPTSLGTGIVCDTGGFIYIDAYQLDIATNWLSWI